MTISESTQGAITILQAHGRLDTASAPETDRRLATIIEGGARQVVLDLSGLEYVSSTGLRVLLTAAKRMKQAQGKMALAAPTSQVRQILDTTGFETIIPLFDTTEKAVESFMPAVPGLTAQPNAPLPQLSFAEEIYLLALDDKQGIIAPLYPSVLDHALAGALLMELALCGRIDTDLTILKVTSAAPTGDPLLDDAMRVLQQRPDPQPLAFWLEAFADQGERIKERVLSRLVERGILKQVDKRIFWVFEVRRYPLIDDREVKEVRARLRELILGEDIPDPRDIVLISLGNACRLLDDLFTPEECDRVRSRIAALARLDLIGRETTNAIREIERRIFMAVMPPPPM